ASKNPKATGELLLTLLERRLDNIVYRSSFAKTRLHGRQMISHAKFYLNGKKVNIPSIITNKGDILTIRKQADKDKLELQDNEIPNWLKIDKNKKSITIVKLPSRENAPFDLNEQLIVEFYNR
ncbi:30S ribosomal protein S4, partial [Candidatus Berkelbacteria bacterium CG_4_9_14_3_um_filter_33_5]